MSNTVLSGSAQTQPPHVRRSKSLAAVVLAVWLVVVTLLGAGEAFVTPAGTPPLLILIGAVAPVVVFLAGLRISSSLREFVLAADLRFMMAVQAWRFAGLGFLALYTYGVLPGSFAWPAGLGDIAIALTAPWMLSRLIRQPGFAAGRTFVAWNVLGILDLIVAIGTGALASFLATGVPGEVSTTPMAQLPLVLIPAYLVPIFVMLHVGALLQARGLNKNQGARA
jgi:hypothetical protein